MIVGPLLLTVQKCHILCTIDEHDTQLFSTWQKRFEIH